jgi:hypothetical protein
VLLADVTLHGEEEDVERLANVLEVVVAKYLEQVVQDVLQHRRPEKMRESVNSGRMPSIIKMRVTSSAGINFIRAKRTLWGLFVKKQIFEENMLEWL